MERFYDSGKKVTEIELLLKNADTIENVDEKITIASQTFPELADIEEQANSLLNSAIGSKNLVNN